MRKRIIPLIAAGALSAAALIGFSPAEAATWNFVDAPVTGVLNLAGNDTEVTTATMNGSYDDETGDVELQLTVPTTVIEQEPFPGVVALVSAEFTNPGGLSGTLDADGNGTVSGNFMLELTDLDLNGSASDLRPCEFGPLALTFNASFDAATGEMVLESDPFDIAPTEDECAGLAAIINGSVASEGNFANLTFSGLGDEIPEETTTTTEATEDTTTTTAPAPAPAPGGTAPAGGAAPVSGSPSYTG